MQADSWNQGDFLTLNPKYTGKGTVSVDSLQLPEGEPAALCFDANQRRYVATENPAALYALSPPRTESLITGIPPASQFSDLVAVQDAIYILDRNGPAILKAGAADLAAYADLQRWPLGLHPVDSARFALVTTTVKAPTAYVLTPGRLQSLRLIPGQRPQPIAIGGGDASNLRLIAFYKKKSTLILVDTKLWRAFELPVRVVEETGIFALDRASVHDFERLPNQQRSNAELSDFAVFHYGEFFDQKHLSRESRKKLDDARARLFLLAVEEDCVVMRAAQTSATPPITSPLIGNGRADAPRLEQWFGAQQLNREPIGRPVRLALSTQGRLAIVTEPEATLFLLTPASSHLVGKFGHRIS
jgi:hypothetical protein